MKIEVLSPGLMTSVQDLGRYGYQKHGVIVSGAMDSYALQIANLLVGNQPSEATLEITLVGPKMKLEKGMLMSITGGDLSPVIEGKAVPLWRPVYIKKECILEFGACRTGCRAYLAVAGGYNIPDVMGSKSTYLRAGIGGFQGRSLQRGDILEHNPEGETAHRLIRHLAKIGRVPFVTSSWYADRGYIASNTKPIKIRVMTGRQFAFFTHDSQERLFSQPFLITTQSDRMGYRLSGGELKLEEHLEMISEAVALGTVQVPPDGNPIILLADRQTAGGYPKIAQVAMVDIPRLAQARPGSKLLFTRVSVKEAEKLYLKREQDIETLKRALSLKLKS
jgi:antagonist of KipI